MNRRPSSLLAHMKESEIREMTRVALECGAINLSQGYPDFPPPREVREAAARAVLEGSNQYTITWGLPALRQAIVADFQRRYPSHFDWVDADRNVTITLGVTEGIVAALMGIAEAGDEVIIVEPAHENYAPAARFSGAEPVFVPLEPPDYALDPERLARAVTPRTKAILLNTPHNPSGRVFTREELASIADLCVEHDLIAVTDEIYDRILYDDREHIPLATLPGMAGRTVTVGGLSKTFSITGWRLGFSVAQEPWSTAARTVHDYTTICAPTPLQEGAVAAYALPDSFYAEQLREYHERRDTMMRILEVAGFEATQPEGAYYTLAGYDAWDFCGDSGEFARFLTHDVGVAVVSGSRFYETPGLATRLVRFAFAKKLDTLEAAGERLVEGFRKR